MPRAAVHVMRRAVVVILLIVLGMVLHGRAQQITLSIGDIAGNGFAARDIRFDYTRGVVAINVGAASLGTQSWQNIRLNCEALKLERARIACDDGVLALAEKIPLSFVYLTDKRSLEVTFKPDKDERWQLSLRPGKRGNDLDLKIDGGRLQRIAPWLPADLPAVRAGVVNGVIRYRGDGEIDARLSVTQAAFADTSALHAGEKIGLTLEAKAAAVAGQMRWNTTLAWTAGEVYWEPVYLKAAHQQLSAEGSLDAKQVRVERGVLRFPGVGDAVFSATYDLAAKALAQGRASVAALPVSALYETLLKPFLAGTSFAELSADGRMSAELEMTDKGVQRVTLQLDRVSLQDKAQRRFALFEIDGSVPWRADVATQAALTVKGGELLKMPLGAFGIALNMNGTRFDLKQARVPLLDGYIDIRDFAALAGASGWYWQFGGEVSGISMDRMTAALGLPVMYGTLHATLPMVRHVKSSLRVDGALSLKVFDGAIEAKNLVLLDLFGKAPRVQADVNMHNLDLQLLTRTYSFGSITGRIDARIAGLELVNWQPVKFDAQLASSTGDYPRKISQTAVQNISALGGAGAAAAIQRSFLRFFEQFGYEKLGWRCKLQNGVCEMSGVEDLPQGYVLVKGGGIPSITVMGYNRQVSWQELLDRIARVTHSNAKPIVK